MKASLRVLVGTAARQAPQVGRRLLKTAKGCARKGEDVLQRAYMERAKHAFKLALFFFPRKTKLTYVCAQRIAQHWAIATSPFFSPLPFGSVAAASNRRVVGLDCAVLIPLCRCCVACRLGCACLLSPPLVSPCFVVPCLPVYWNRGGSSQHTHRAELNKILTKLAIFDRSQAKKLKLAQQKEAREEMKRQRALSGKGNGKAKAGGGTKSQPPTAAAAQAS